MTEGIIIALIAAAAAVFGNWLTSRKSEAARDQRVDDKLTGIERRLDEHNGYAAKFADLTGDIQAINIALTAMQKDIEYIKKGQTT